MSPQVAISIVPGKLGDLTARGEEHAIASELKLAEWHITSDSELVQSTVISSAPGTKSI